jgi:regulation of enolase protein 1 (concanavalin A-like superfamily)
LLLTLGLAQAQEIAWQKAAYWDLRYPTNWVTAADASAMRDGLQAAGYTILNADELKTWMNARSVEKTLSVVVFCRDVAPDTVIETQSSSCTLRKYLDAGGKIVWFGDIPFYNQGHADNTSTNWANAGAPAVLGFDTSTAPRDSRNTCALTPAGKAWGLTATWPSQRPAAPRVTTLEILATDNAGNAAAWAKHYLAGDLFRGFVRLRDTGGPADVADLVRVAEYTAVKAYNPQPASGAVAVTMALLQWNAGPSAVWQEVYFGTDPNLGAAAHVASQTYAQPVYFYPPGLTPGTTYYWRIDSVDAQGAVYPGDVWSFTAMPATAWTPSPVDGAAYVATDLVLGWRAGVNATTHDVYLSTDRAAVESGAASARKADKQSATSYAPPTLERGRTYFWRVDENVLGATVPGPIWSFSVRPIIAKADPALVGWWKMDDEKSGVAVDYSGYDNYGTLVNGPAFVAGYLGDALSFDGVDDYVNCGNDASLTKVDSVSVTAWIKMSATGRDQKIASNQNGSTGGYKLGVYSGNGQVEFEIRTAANTAILNRTAPGGVVPDRDVWCHVVGVYDKGKALRTYVNGKLDRELATAEIAGISTGALMLGRESYSSAYYWLGLMDDVRVYNKALTEPEIQKVMQGDPLLAWAPQPATGATLDIRDATDLSWSAGQNATGHDVYLGRDRDAVQSAEATSPLYRGRRAGTSFPMAGLVEFGGGSYFWRIDEVEADNVTIHKGLVWSFIIPAYLFVDDFESYDDADHRIYDAWTDGYTDGRSNSIVGNWQAPFAERTIVHGGKQSLPMDYNNLVAPYFSEATLEFAPVQDWTSHGVTALSLWYRGYPIAFSDNGNNAFTVSGGGNDIWNAADAFRFAYKKLSGNGSITARVDSQTNTNAWAKAGVMIRESLDPGSPHAMMVVTPSSGASFQRRTAAAGASANTDAAGIKAPYWVRMTRTGNVLKAEIAPDGKTWTQVGTDLTVAMGTNVYLGLAVTAHDATRISTVEFSHVAITGGVFGLWQATGIGSDPQPGNAPEPLYLAVEDSAGQSVVVAHPDPSAVLTTTWTQWKVPLTSLTGVRLTEVKKLSLGVGDREAPTPGGAGRILIDDIQVIRQ